MLLNDVLKEFLFEIKIRNYSPRTQKGYKNNNALFHTWIDHEYQITELEEVTHLHIKQYVTYLLQKGRKPTYVNGILKNIRSFFEYCVGERYVNKNPCKQVKWVKEGKVIINTFTDKEVVDMLNYYKGSDYLSIRNKCIIAMLVDTGIRNNELCTLTINDIGETTIKILGKGNKERYVYISPMLKKYLIKYERVREMYFKNHNIQFSNYFLSYRAKPLTVEGIERVVKKSGEHVREGIRVSPHTVRHYFAQKQLQNGLDMYSLSRLLGHETVSITKRYLDGLQDERIVEMSIKTSPLMNL
ncbi:MAG: tyrosine-type recombinase/integrase [Clostridium sp.]|uniref:tyrosine-type recombinase/integrase n=1 Tax=Clostridium sp. TaxID=1506 RepID=UPI003D6CA78E